MERKDRLILIYKHTLSENGRSSPYLPEAWRIQNIVKLNRLSEQQYMGRQMSEPTLNVWSRSRQGL